MAEYRNQHYVPVFYLKQWCGTDSRLCVFRRPNDLVVSGRYSPTQTGYERDLNDLYGVPKEARKGVEKDVLARVDGEGSEALRILLSDSASLLTAELRSAWVRFIVSMFYRHPQTISMMRKEGEQTFRKELEQGQAEYKAEASPSHEETFVEFVENRNPGVFRDIGVAIMPELIADRRIGEIPPSLACGGGLGWGRGEG